jgi:hypothetical protein
VDLVKRLEVNHELLFGAFGHPISLFAATLILLNAIEVQI